MAFKAITVSSDPVVVLAAQCKSSLRTSPETTQPLTSEAVTGRLVEVAAVQAAASLTSSYKVSTQRILSNSQRDGTAQSYLMEERAVICLCTKIRNWPQQRLQEAVGNKVQLPRPSVSVVSLDLSVNHVRSVLSSMIMALEFAYPAVTSHQIRSITILPSQQPSAAMSALRALKLSTLTLRASLPSTFKLRGSGDQEALWSSLVSSV